MRICELNAVDERRGGEASGSAAHPRRRERWDVTPEEPHPIRLVLAIGGSSFSQPVTYHGWRTATCISTDPGTTSLLAVGGLARRVPSLKDLWVTGTCPGPHDYVSREGKSPLRLVWAVRRP